MASNWNRPTQPCITRGEAWKRSSTTSPPPAPSSSGACGSGRPTHARLSFGRRGRCSRRGAETSPPPANTSAPLCVPSASRFGRDRLGRLSRHGRESTQPPGSCTRTPCASTRPTAVCGPPMSPWSAPPADPPPRTTWPAVRRRERRARRRSATSRATSRCRLGWRRQRAGLPHRVREAGSRWRARCGSSTGRRSREGGAGRLGGSVAQHMHCPFIISRFHPSVPSACMACVGWL
mmetsp:Transcript_17968/g.58785  ORF Transcript_17968/g.58785 Transcript_17968/m.58785 type:complete len:235 (+) Transcript_17968:1051-1755(+)